MTNSPLLLVIDDEPTILKTVKEILEDEQYRVETLHDGTKALDVIGKLIPDLVLLDIFMPNCNGLKLLRKIKQEYPHQKVIIISGFGNIPIAVEAIQHGAIDFIEKPLNLEEILSKIAILKKSTKTNSTTTQETTINLETNGIIGKSYLFLELIQQINQVAPLQLPLLMYGQHGTGKTLLSHYIHQTSTRKNTQLLTLHCSALNRQQEIKSINTLFSHAHGTFFIKHVEHLSLDGQKTLLSHLHSYNKANIKIIASSCISLFLLQQANKFHAPLFYELNITPIEIPPLNKRKYDIPLLVDYFVKTYNKKYNKHILLNTKSIRTLRNHYWQGNITQLKTFIEQVVHTTKTENHIVIPEDLLEYLQKTTPQLIEEQIFHTFKTLKQAKDEFEKHFLLYYLKKNRYDTKQVLNQLDLTPVQLRDKLLKFKIENKL